MTHKRRAIRTKRVTSLIRQKIELAERKTKRLMRSSQTRTLISDLTPGKKTKSTLVAFLPTNQKSMTWQASKRNWQVECQMMTINPISKKIWTLSRKRQSTSSLR